MTFPSGSKTALCSGNRPLNEPAIQSPLAHGATEGELEVGQVRPYMIEICGVYGDALIVAV
jgi:hypothetical protein